MRIPCILSYLFMWAATAQGARLIAQPEFTVQSMHDAGRETVPVYHAGHLLSFDPSRAAVRSFRQGVDKVHELLVAVPGAKELTIRRVTGNEAGTVVIAATAVSESGQPAPVLIWVDAGSRISRVVRTAPFAAAEIAFAADGTLWVAGRMYDAAYQEAPSYDVLRRYDAEGKLIQTALPRSAFGTRDSPATVAYLSLTSRTVALYSVEAREVVELDFNGAVLRRRPFSLPSDVKPTGFAALDSGVLCVSGQRRSNRDAAIPRAVVFTMQPNSPALVPADAAGLITPQSGGIVIGTAGDRLALFHSGGKLSLVSIE